MPRGVPRIGSSRSAANEGPRGYEPVARLGGGTSIRGIRVGSLVESRSSYRARQGSSFLVRDTWPRSLYARSGLRCHSRSLRRMLPERRATENREHRSRSHAGARCKGFAASGEGARARRLGHGGARPPSSSAAAVDSRVTVAFANCPHSTPSRSVYGCSAQCETLRQASLPSMNVSLAYAQGTAPPSGCTPSAARNRRPSHPVRRAAECATPTPPGSHARCAIRCTAQPCRNPRIVRPGDLRHGVARIPYRVPKRIRRHRREIHLPAAIDGHAHDSGSSPAGKPPGKPGTKVDVSRVNFRNSRAVELRRSRN